MAQSSAKWIPGADAAKAMRTGADRGVALAAEHLLGEARKIVPHETGVLERSGRASTEQTGEVVRGAVSFDTPYLRSCATRGHVTQPRCRQVQQVPGRAAELGERHGHGDCRKGNPRCVLD